MVAAEDDTKLDRTLGDLKESLRVLRMSSAAVNTPEEGDDVSKLREHLKKANASARVQDECIGLCEAALRVQEEAVAIMPNLVAKERAHATAARERAAEAIERAASLQGELDRRKAHEKKIAQEAALATKRADETEERAQALQAKQLESVKSAQRMSSELQQAKRKEEEQAKLVKSLQAQAQKRDATMEAEREAAAKKLEAALARGKSAAEDDKLKSGRALEEERKRGEPAPPPCAPPVPLECPM